MFPDTLRRKPGLRYTWYDPLQIKATQRLQHGLSMQVAYTWEKELTNGTNSNFSYVVPSACLEKSYQERDVFLVFLPILPEFRHLHDDPRFTDLLHRIGLPVPRDIHLKQAGY